MSFRNEFLRRHNELRAFHGAPPLQWDNSLEMSAQNWANHLKEVGTLAHGQMGNCGQSLAVDINKLSGDRVTQRWYDEKEFYDFNNPGWNQHCTNFTQIVWKSTQKVGASVATSPTNGMTFIVAHYYPAGNVGSFRNNVKIPISSGSAPPMTRRGPGAVPPPPPLPDVPPPPPPEDGGDSPAGSNYLRKAMLGVFGPVPYSAGGRGDSPPPQQRQQQQQMMMRSPMGMPQSIKDVAYDDLAPAHKKRFERRRFNDLKEFSVDHMRTLGWTPSMLLDGSCPESESTTWNRLTPQEQNAARGIGYKDAQTWDQAQARLMADTSGGTWDGGQALGGRGMGEGVLGGPNRTAKLWDAALHMVRFKKPAGEARRAHASGAHTSLAKIRATKKFEEDPAMLNLQEIIQREFMGKIEASPQMLQQLRGVFSAADDDNDGFLTLPQLEQALLSFGVRPTDDLVEHFVMLSRSSGKIDLATFMYVFTKTRGNAAVQDCSSEVLGLFRFLDKPFSKNDSGNEDNLPVRVSREDLHHVLTEVHVPNKLSKQEASDFITYADALMRKSQPGGRGRSSDIDFDELVKLLVDFKGL